MSDFDLKNAKVAVVGLGYVGLPLALELAKYNDVIGFDIHEGRIRTLQNGQDTNEEIADEAIRNSRCKFTNDISAIEDCNIYIVTVPTPIDDQKRPDLTALEKASKAVGSLINKNDIIVYESTVYPGVTEDICAPILAQKSNLKSGEDFFLGYSPERINPGDTKNTLANMAKIVAGQNEQVADFLCNFYGQINNGNIFKAKDIKTAEAAKAIENAQRDINVAFINEVTMILNKLELSAYDVLEAANTKWNFLPFTPGLVGGHCIGVDPYYLAKCALDQGHNPEIILAGRNINDSMGCYFANHVHEILSKKSKILVLGFTFKENISDTRNTKVIDVVRSLEIKGHEVDTHDIHASPEAVREEYNLDLSEKIQNHLYDAIVLTVGHKEYASMPAREIEAYLKNGTGLIYDIKAVWRQHQFSDAVQYVCL